MLFVQGHTAFLQELLGGLRFLKVGGAVRCGLVVQLLFSSQLLLIGLYADI